MQKRNYFNLSVRIFSVLFCLAMVLASSAILQAQEVRPLWPDEAPNAVGDDEEDKTEMTIFLPEQTNESGSAIVIFPGGGYGHLAIDHEGYDVAKRLNALGIAAFVVKYRYGKQYGHPVPLTDAKRAIRTVRHQSKDWNIKPDRIGILGFSAGGHLASTAGTHFDDGIPSHEDAIEQHSSRPDFMILVYPVISMSEGITHEGSRNNLLGKYPDPAMIDSLSNEKQITSETPPTFLIHSSDDTAVTVENSLVFYRELRNHEVPAEMHIFEEGPHGFGLAEENSLLSSWPDLLEKWLKHRGIIE